MLMARVLERAQSAGGRDCLKPAETRPANGAVCGHRTGLRRPKSRSGRRSRPMPDYSRISRRCWPSTRDRDGVLAVGHNPNCLSVSGPHDHRQRRRGHPHAQRLHRPRSIWTTIRRACSGSSIRARRAPSTPASQRVPAQRPRGSNPPPCAATTTQAPRPFAPAGPQDKPAWDRPWPRIAEHR